MNSIAAWAAPAATMVAAMMTAANLGARVTGWGFVVFTIGSVGWCAIAHSTDQQNLLWTIGFLTLVNGAGVWRWLGRKARYEAGGKSAEVSSAAARSPSLMALGALAGAKLVSSGGEKIGTLVDGMMRCGDAALAYVVMTDGASPASASSSTCSPPRRSPSPRSMSSAACPSRRSGSVDRSRPINGRAERECAIGRYGEGWSAIL